MPERIIISNTSPVFYLHQVGHLEILRDIYGTVVIPRGVAKELEAGAAKGLEIPDLANIPWLEVRPLKNRSLLPMVPDLGVGEAEVIALALETEEDCLMILDDVLGRQIALLNNLRMTGTLGVLLRAKAEGLIARLAPLLEALKAKKMSDALIERVLAEAGE